MHTLSYQPDAEYDSLTDTFYVFYKGFRLLLKQINDKWIVSHRKLVINESTCYTDAIRAIKSL